MALLMGFCVAVTAIQVPADEVARLHNRAEYMPPKSLRDFERDTGITVEYRQSVSAAELDVGLASQAKPSMPDTAGPVINEQAATRTPRGPVANSWNVLFDSASASDQRLPPNFTIPSREERRRLFFLEQLSDTQKPATDTAWLRLAMDGPE